VADLLGAIVLHPGEPIVLDDRVVVALRVDEDLLLALPVLEAELVRALPPAGDELLFSVLRVRCAGSS